ncbi:MAG: hypothetical protein AB8B64_27420 [Granulosicoccus sp.]
MPTVEEIIDSIQSSTEGLSIDDLLARRTARRWLNDLLTASVQNGVRYAAPVPTADAVAPAGVELVTPRRGTSGEVRLT